MSSYNATIRIDRTLWDKFKNKCNDDGSNATAEITKFIEIYLVEGDYDADKEKLPRAFINLRDAILSQVLAEFSDRFNMIADANTALIHAEINKLQSGNSEENLDIATNEALAKKDNPQDSQDRNINSSNTSDSASDNSNLTDNISNGMVTDRESHSERLYSDIELIEAENLKVSRQTVGRWRNGKRSTPKNIKERWQPNGKGWIKIKSPLVV